MFHWTLLKNSPIWDKILHSTKHTADVETNIMKILDEDGLFDKFIHISNISKTRMDEWNTKSLTTFERWSEIFEFVRSECISLKNSQLILELSSAIPGTSGAIKRVFAITNALWTDKKSCFLVETIKVVIVTKTHFQKLSCSDFYALISNNPKLLQEIYSSTKHKTSTQDRTTPSTSTGNWLQIKFCKY
jgi:hypothetical protein